MLRDIFLIIIWNLYLYIDVAKFEESMVINMVVKKKKAIILAIVGIVIAITLPIGVMAGSSKNILKSQINHYMRTAPDAKLVYPIDMKNTANEWPESMLDIIMATPERTVIEGDSDNPYTLSFKYSDSTDYWITSEGEKATSVRAGELPNGEQMRCILTDNSADSDTIKDAVYFYTIIDPSTGTAQKTFIEGENRLVVSMLSPCAEEGKYTQKILWTTLTGK